MGKISDDSMTVSDLFQVLTISDVLDEIYDGEGGFRDGGKQRMADALGKSITFPRQPDWKPQVAEINKYNPRT